MSLKYSLKQKRHRERSRWRSFPDRSKLNILILKTTYENKNNNAKNSWDGILIQMSYKCKTKSRTVKEMKEIKNYIYKKKNLCFYRDVT